MRRLNNLAKIIKMSLAMRRASTLPVSACPSHHWSGTTSPSAEGVLKMVHEEVAEWQRQWEAGEAGAVQRVPSAHHAGLCSAGTTSAKGPRPAQCSAAAAVSLHEGIFM